MLEIWWLPVVDLQQFAFVSALLIPLSPQKEQPLTD